ncbi:putative disease resistance protein [Trifolium repens]|nr:putative disease resistance protein [Trifolium repens]
MLLFLLLLRFGPPPPRLLRRGTPPTPRRFQSLRLSWYIVLMKQLRRLLIRRGTLDPDDVTITKRYVELLEPGKFVNDNIIDFYIKYLKNQLRTDEQEMFQFFNCFFFRKLIDNDPSRAFDGKESFSTCAQLE